MDSMAISIISAVILVIYVRYLFRKWRHGSAQHISTSRNSELLREMMWDVSRDKLESVTHLIDTMEGFPTMVHRQAYLREHFLPSEFEEISEIIAIGNYPEAYKANELLYKKWVNRLFDMGYYPDQVYLLATICTLSTPRD